jgi:hypothetical protein
MNDSHFGTSNDHILQQFVFFFLFFTRPFHTLFGMLNLLQFSSTKRPSLCMGKYNRCLFVYVFFPSITIQSFSEK